MVARQWWKHVIGSSHQEGSQDPFTAWNESSRRYITEEIQFYVPNENEWRSVPDNSKQGSGLPVGTPIGKEASKRLLDQIEAGMQNYEWAVENNIATEMHAYLILLLWSVCSMVLTTSLQAVAHFLKLRLDSHAQQEIQDYSKAVHQLVEEKFPIALDKLMK